MSAYDPTFENRLRNAVKNLDIIESDAQKENDPRFQAFERYMQGSNI